MAANNPNRKDYRDPAALEAENRLLREEIRVSRQAAEITAQLVVEQFEKADLMMTRLQSTSATLATINQDLEAANLRLQKLDRMKSDFLSSVSHELRTPLTSIRGFASLIDREFLRSFAPLAGEDAGLNKKSRRIRDNLDIILKESERLTRLINDVLDLAKIEAGRVEWRDVPIQPEVLARDAANAAHGMFDAKPAVALRLEIQEGLPTFIGDPDRMQQVLVNLLNNAIKFTMQGHITLRALLNTDHQIQLEVQDTGMGFPPADAEAIFDKFQQSKQGDTLSGQPKGTGLGLAISQEIVARHGGRIWASSEPGKGSLFCLTLPPVSGSSPLGTGAGPTGPDQAATVAGWADDDAKSRILVVDDDDGIRSYLAQLLQEHGFEVICAEDGLAAIEAAKLHFPHLITMDLAMPVMDGRTAIMRLRADPVLQQVPIMVISAIPGRDRAGGDLTMDKPLHEQRFLENVHLLLDKGKHQRSEGTHCLVLHDGHETPVMLPGVFSPQCKVEFCALDQLVQRIQSDFCGMLVIPTHLIGSVDLGMLQAMPTLEIMIMPMSSCQSIPDVQPS